MSKASTPIEVPKAARRQQWRKLELMIDAYASGEDRLDDEILSIETISSEIVARYRPMLREPASKPARCPICDSITVRQDSHHWDCSTCGERGEIQAICHDGPLFDLISRAMRAERKRFDLN